MPHLQRSQTPRRDDGAVLPLVLIVVVVLSVIAVALASYTTVSLRTADIADQNISRLSAAESGMQLALQDAANNPGACNGTAQIRPPLNNASVTTTCWRVVELADLDALYAMVLTGEGPGGGAVTETALQINGANSDNGVKDISGPIYLASPGGVDLAIDPENGRAVVPDPDNPALQLPGVIRYEPTSGSCPATTSYDAAAWNGTPLLLPQVTCTESDWDDSSVAPPPDFSSEAAFATLTTTISPTAAPAVPDTTTWPGCAVYEPGTYPAPPSLSAPSFFRSGLYYFPSGLIEIDEATVIGKRSPSSFFPDATAAGLDPACVPAWNADPDDSGAVFVLGTDARIFTKGNTARLHIYGREILDSGVPADPIDFAVIGLTQAQAVAAGADFSGVAGVSIPINLPVSPTPDKIIDRQNGSSSSISFYGQVYTPHSWVDTGNAAGGVFVEFLGGIVAGRMTIKTAANVDGFIISVPTDVINAFYIESVAVTSGTLSNGTSAVRTRSIEEPGIPPAPDRLSVASWRVCPRGDC